MAPSSSSNPDIGDSTARVLLFAAARELAGAGFIDVQATFPVSVNEFREILSAQFPTLAPLLKVSRLAVNQVFVDNASSITDRDEIALIPPVSGG